MAIKRRVTQRSWEEEGIDINNNATAGSAPAANTAYSYPWNAVMANYGPRSSNMWNTGQANKERIVLPTVGAYYSFQFGFPWSSTSGTTSQFWVGKNGTGYHYSLNTITSTDNVTRTLWIGGVARCNTAGDWLQLCYNTTVASGTAISSGFYINPYAQIYRTA